MSGRRLVTLLAICAAIGIPAVALRAACAGRSCSNGGGDEARIPFCPLPDALKADLAAGFREGRSPDVFAVTRGAIVHGGSDPADDLVPWPSLGAADTTGVPIVFSGTGVDASATVPGGTGLDQIAPTISDIIGLRRRHPGVRAGVAVNGVAAGEHPRLVLEIALKGIGTPDVLDSSWPLLDSLFHRGAGTLHGTTGSLPLDPAATLTTLGTGGLPSQHGITGSYVRNNDGDVVRAWGDGAPLSVIATLPDDLDEKTGQRSMVGLVATDEADRGLIGGNWYPDHDRDAVTVASAPGSVTAARDILAQGFGRDAVPDILGVVLAGPRADARIGQIVGLARRASGGSLLVVVAGTGTNGADPNTVDATGSDVVQQVEDLVEGSAPIVDKAVAGGLFLDQATLASEQLSGDAAVQALLRVTTPDGQRMMADAFQGFAVSFARYC
ncbi:MAG: hypothetical protein ABI879_01735 [Actinomycetota bacterium]